MPFSKGVFIIGDPIWVPKNLDDTLIENKRLELEEQLNIITEKADRRWDRQDGNPTL